MDQKKIGKFLKELRNEKQLTQEQLAAVFNVSSRTVSRWETGNNLPDISLLVEIADYYDVDVREIIEGERKSEMMDKEVKEVAEKMADYATEEKSSLLRSVQALCFVGVVISFLAVYFQTRDVEWDYINKSAFFASVSALLIMAVITLYVTGLLEKLISKKTIIIKVIKFATIIALVIGFFQVVLLTATMTWLFASVALARPKVRTDIENYNDYMSFSNHAYEKGVETDWTKWEMDETIWPEKINDSMEVEDFKMVYYNPWDEQFLGYMVVDYDADAYEKEVQRLKDYDSTEYIGYYSVTEERTYDLLAVNSDPYYGFVYALTDGKGRIIYAEQIFCNYFMDLKYEKYMPKEYFLDGFDASANNPYKHEMSERDSKAVEGL